MILMVSGTLVVQGVDLLEKHACQNHRQTAMILLAELMILVVLGTLAAQGVDF